MLPRYSTFQLKLEHGGLSAPILKDMLDARLISIWIKLLSSNLFWAEAERQLISIRVQSIRGISVFQSLSQSTIKLKGWPDHWKPYLNAWKRLKGQINSTQSWPWQLESLKINNVSGEIYSVKEAVKSLYLKPTTSSIPIIRNKEYEDPKIFNWFYTGKILNKKKDIFWRFMHKALPLGYRLMHISRSELGNCPNCPNMIQSLHHFALECEISQKIWKTTYLALNNSAEDKYPSTLEEIILATNIQNIAKRKSALWIHINALYEIWCWYTQAKWGNNLINEEIISNVTRIRVKKELKILQKSFQSKNKHTSNCNFLKFINFNL
jgi:hypothetical protein